VLALAAVLRTARRDTMRTRTEWCEECQRRAAGFLVPESQSAGTMKNLRFREDERLDDFVLARGTGAELEEKATFRQEPWRGKRPVIWKPEHELHVEIDTWDGWSDDEPRERVYYRHIALRNRSASRSHRAHLCDLPETFKLTGPGAEAHIAADAKVVQGVVAKLDLDKRTKARAKAESAEAEAYGQQLVAVLKTLDVEATSSSSHGFLYREDSPRKPDDFVVSMSLKVAARVAEALGGTVARPPAEPMPLWKVWYGETKAEDKEPLYVAARSRPAVVAHMTATYCHERTPGDEPNVPLKPERLIIEEAGPDPEVPEEDTDEKAA
jgi:hypothetical protein